MSFKAFLKYYYNPAKNLNSVIM